MAMRVTMLLADSAHVAGGKLYVWGGGWSVMGPGPTAMSIGLRIEIPPDEIDREHQWRLALLDEEGRPVPCAAHGTHSIERSGSFHARQLTASRPGVPVDL